MRDVEAASLRDAYDPRPKRLDLGVAGRLFGVQHAVGFAGLLRVSKLPHDPGYRVRPRKPTRSIRTPSGCDMSCLTDPALSTPRIESDNLSWTCQILRMLLYSGQLEAK